MFRKNKNVIRLTALELSLSKANYGGLPKGKQKELDEIVIERAKVFEDYLKGK